MTLLNIRLLFLIFLVILGVSIPQKIYSQLFKGYTATGFNLTQVDGDEVFGYKKFGLNLGVGVVMPVAKKWSISLENSFSQKGSYQSPRFIDSASGEYRLILHYVEVPLMIHFEDKETMTFGAGVSWGRLVNVKEYEHGTIVPGTTLKGPYNRTDWDIIGDIRFRIYKQLKFNFRYSYSLVKIRTRTFNNTQQNWTRKQYNNILSLRLIYMFNEKHQKKKPEKD